MRIVLFALATALVTLHLHTPAVLVAAATLVAPVVRTAPSARAAPVVHPPAIHLEQALSLRDLENAVYDLGDSSSVEGGKVPLSGGRWSDPSEGGSVFALLPMHATGDLDADGRADAAVLLVEETTGGGRFSYLFALMNRDGKPVQLGPPEWLGDRTVVQRLTIDRRGIITVRFLTHKANDPECCPTLRIEDRYRVEQGQLVGIIR
jgi:hypothetical protein